MQQRMQSAVSHALPNMPDVLCDLVAQYSHDTIRKVFSQTLMPSYELNDQRYELQNGSIYNTTTNTIAYLDGKIDVFNIVKINDITYFIINTGCEGNKYLILLDTTFKICARQWSYSLSMLYVVDNIIFAGICSSIEKYILRVGIDRYTGNQSITLEFKGGILSPYNAHVVKTVYKNTVVTYNYAENHLEFYQNNYYQKIDCIDMSAFKIPALNWNQSHYTQGRTSCIVAENMAGNLLVYINNHLLTIEQMQSDQMQSDQMQSDQTIQLNPMLRKKIKYHVIQVSKYNADNLYRI